MDKHFNDVMAVHFEVFGQDVDLDFYGDDGCFAVRSDDGRLTGYLLCQVVDDFADLHYVVVVPEFRRRGFGVMLMREFLNSMTNRGVRNVTLEVSSRNVAAISLYDACGFERVGMRRGYYRDGSDGIVMNLELLGVMPGE